VAALADLLRLARDRAPLLSAPGDLRAFHEYWLQLTEDEQRAFQDDDEDRLNPATGADESPDAVSLLTAHKAKGLEFDTVFVVRVSPQHGFGKVKGEDHELPDGLEDRAGDTRDNRSRRRAEARRLFYVACTRAERHLVLLAKKKKSRTENDYFQELTSDPAGLATRRSAADVFEQAARAGVTLASRGLTLEPGAREGWEDELARQRSAARAAAADALESVERAGAQPADLDRAAGALRSAAARLAVIAHMEQSGESPEWSGAEPAAAALASLLARRLAEEHAPAPATQPVRPPLHLSYSAVSEYHRCPRCFYLKNVLRLPEPASGALFVGDLAHRALQAHFTALRRHESDEGPPPMDPAAAARDLYLSSLAPGASADPHTLAQLHAMLAAACSLHQATDEIAEIEFTLDFPYEHDGVQHSFTAKLDRLDVWSGGGHRIIDYKTGKASDRFTSPDPRDTQLGVYALALRHHQGIDLADRDTPARGVAEYWHLPTGSRGRIDLAEIDYPYIRTQIDKAISGMLEGRFEPKKGCEGLCTYITL
jgi:ATP-dependent exoDNAse (exonuclease V) beta subunit